jgi:hypothetical protein
MLAFAKTKVATIPKNLKRTDALKTVRLLIHSLALALIDIGAVLTGFGLYTLVRPAPQRAVQIPVAVLIAVGSFLLWSLAVKRWSGRRLSLSGAGELAGTWLLTLLWTPTLFIPLHYLGRGYLTSWANIWNLWLFQMPVNAAAAGVVWTLIRDKNI